MRLIKNRDTRASSAHRQNPSQETSAVNNIPSDAELDELFSFQDDPDFMVGSAQGRAELRRLVLSSPIFEDSGSAAGSGTAAAAGTNGVETTACAIPSTHLRRSMLHQLWGAQWILSGAAAAIIAITCTIGISLSNKTPDVAQTRPPHGKVFEVEAHGKALEELAALPSNRFGTSFKFAANSATIAPDEEADIRDLATEIHALIIDYPNFKVTITGHTANAEGGTLAGRYEMSLARAQTVASFLATAGVPAEQMIVAADSNEYVAAQMRRVDVVLNFSPG